MAKIYDEEINKNTDWGGDESTGGLPVAGGRVQEFIKKSLNGKMGIFYYDPSNNRYLVFADEESRDLYLENPEENIGLLLGTFNAPFNYTAEISLISKQYVAIPLGKSGNYIEFTFDTKNKNGVSVGEDVICTYTITRGSSKKIVTKKYRSGITVRFNIDEYLEEGMNIIRIGIVGQSTLAATTVGVTYQVVDLKLSDDFDISRVYDMSGENVIMEVPFTLAGYGAKVVEWYLDGTKLGFDKNVDEVVVSSSSRVKYIPLSGLSRGVSSLEFRAYTVIDGERFYSDVLHRDIIVENTGPRILTPIIAAAYEKEFLESEGIKFMQYAAYGLRFAVHNPLNPVYTSVDLFLDEEKLSTLNVENNIENTYSIVSNETGAKVVKIVAGETEYNIPSNIEETPLNIREITSSLELAFSAIGKSNNSADRASWSNGGYTALLTGFSFTQTSGWLNNKLLMGSGSKIEFNYRPLAKESTKTGKTIEFEFASSNVSDDNAVICDLRNTTGTGILITASEAMIVSRGGVKLSVKYKSEENIRISFVINRATGVTNKGLVFIYVDGILSGANNFGTSDDFISDKVLSFSGSESSEVILKQVRTYDLALTPDQILNNYILYQDTTEDMLSAYYRNDVYDDYLVESLSLDKLMGQLPVMLVTGDIPTLENTTNKDTQITVDVEYFNLQDPAKSFTMKNAAMRPQGTSSMLYPKKNFRIYTQKLADTKVYDYTGKIIADKLYSFKDKAIPVNCWCLKADYAESSGTHNTGIAKLWNDVMYNSSIKGEFVLRTGAQKAALENNYMYDVRTTIDGFPILLFYRMAENEEPIFIGKYNFNNDKSTESVFGFKDIPGFDDSKMQCWEVLNNGDALALFTNVSDFDTRWQEAYESRYPDVKSPNTSYLKQFALWVNKFYSGNNASAFSEEKWEHLDVYKVAAYYVYFMRFGAVDQLVKNAMLTSEDGVHWFFINYDNDTVNGLANNGVLVFDPYMDRQTLDPTSGGAAYAYAGHDSVLWNTLEADAEFMEIVKEVDNALYANGLSYDNVIRMFNKEQSDKWNERIYNQDSQYKYIEPYTDSGLNNLPMLQGSRKSHRKWWLARRFSLYDAKFVSGDFKGKALEFKVINNTPAGWKFTIEAGSDMDYGYGIYNPKITGVSLKKGETHTFTVDQELNIGDPVRIYSAVNLQGVDLSNILPRLSNIELNNVWNDSLGTRLKKFILGNGVSTNVILTSVSSIAKAKRLEYLDIRGCEGITAIDLSKNIYLATVRAEKSGLTSIELAKGAPVVKLTLPQTMQVIRLEQLTELTTSGFSVDVSMANVRSLTITGCPKMSQNILFANYYLTSRADNFRDTTLYMDNVSWMNVNPAEFLKICDVKVKGGATIILKGTVKLTESSQDIIDQIIAAFGPDVFRPGNELYVSAPDAIYLVGPDSILEGENAKFTAAVFSENLGTVAYSISSGSRTGVTIDEKTGYLTSVENGLSNSTLTIRATHVPTSGNMVYTEKALVIEKRVYPSNITINGPSAPNQDDCEYTWSTTTEGVNGNYRAEWALSDGIEEYLQIAYQDNERCVLSGNWDVVIAGKLNLSLIKVADSSIIVTTSKTIELRDPNIVVSKATNPEVMAILYANGFCESEDYITRDEVALITDIGIAFKNSSIKTFDEFGKFTSVTSIGERAFLYCYDLTSIIIPDSVTSIRKDAFYGCAALKSITIGASVTSIGDNAFSKCGALTSIIIPDSVTSIGTRAFYSCGALTSIIIPDSVTSIGDYAFSDCGALTSIIVSIDNKRYDSRDNCNAIIETGTNTLVFGCKNTVIPDSVTSIGQNAFYDTALTSIIIPDSVTSIGQNAFKICKALTSIIIPDSVTSIGLGAFYECTALKSITIGASVTSIGDYAFYSCGNLNKISVLHNMAPSTDYYTFGYSGVSSSFTGRNTYNTGENIVYVPANATGYDTGYWLNPLQDPEKCGFTISYTL